MYARLNLPIEYPPPYTREVWDYSKTQFDLINKVIENDLVFETTERISSFDISKDEITRIITSLDPNKAHGHDEISICMLKLCVASISKLLSLLLKLKLENECFPNEWNKANFVPIHKKGNKQLI